MHPFPQLSPNLNPLLGGVPEGRGGLCNVWANPPLPLPGGDELVNFLDGGLRPMPNLLDLSPV